MAKLRLQGRLAAGDAALDRAITDLGIATDPDGTRWLVAASGAGVARYALAPGAAPSLADTLFLPEADPAAARARLSAFAGPETALAHLAAGADALALRALGPEGFDAPQSRAAPGGTAPLVAWGDGAGRLVLAAPGGLWSLAPDTPPRWLADGKGAALASVTGLAAAEFGGRTILLAADAGARGVTAIDAGEAGRLTVTGHLGAGDGTGLMVPTAIETVTLDGVRFAIVASAAAEGASGALSVMRIGADGGLAASDHVTDTRATRFGAVQALEVVTAADRVFLLAGGGDDGISLFTLLSDGRLLHLESLAEGIEGGLGALRALAATGLGETLAVFAATGREAGITRLGLSLAGLGARRLAEKAGGRLVGTGRDDLLEGRGGDDRIEGRDGADILFDGAGADTLLGGLGADRFVLAADGDRDVVADFDPGADRLDLGRLPFLYDPRAVAIAPTATGATLSWRDELLVLRAAARRPLEPDEVRAAILAGPDRSFAAPIVDWQGGPGDDRQAGDWAADTLDGGGGDDSLSGGAGSDLLSGGAGADTLEGGPGGDSLYGGGGDDRVTGDGGADWAALGPGDDLYLPGAAPGPEGDTVEGGDGDDTLRGGPSGDVFHGGAGDDLIEPGAGDDSVEGGTGRDLADLGPGDDLYRDTDEAGWPGADTVRGGAGRDRIEGGGGHDLIEGGDGADTLEGGSGHDTLAGGAGGDLVQGGRGRDRAWLGPGNDTYADTGQGGWLGRDLVRGGPGGDRITTGGGQDTVEGGMGPDQVHLGFGADRFTDTRQGGPRGRDTVDGAAGDDRIETGGGHDLIEGGTGHDTLAGGPGDDVIRGGRGRDRVWLGPGDDTYADTGQGGWLGRDRVRGGPGGDRIASGGGHDTVEGGFGPDRAHLGFGHDLYADTGQSGPRGRDTVLGAAGNDRIATGGANDVLAGGRGDDTLEGGIGRDLLTGGPGADVFVFGPRSGRDAVTDFDPGLDTIALRGLGPTEVAAESWARGLALVWDEGHVLLRGLGAGEWRPEDLDFL